MRIVLQKTVGGGFERALKRLDLQIQRRAFKHIAVAVDAHIAGGTRLIVRGVVLQPVGFDHRARLAHFRLAFDDGFQVRAAADLLAHQKDRRGVQLRLADTVRQAGCGLER